MSIILIPTDWNGAFKGEDLTKVRTDARRYTNNFDTKKKVVVVTGFEKMTETAKMIINNAVAKAEFKQSSAFDALKNVPEHLFKDKVFRGDKAEFTEGIPFSPDRIEKEYQKIITSYSDCWVIVISHPLTTETILLEYVKMYNIENEAIPNYVAMPGDTIFLGKEKILDKKRYGGRIIPHARFRNDKID